MGVWACARLASKSWEICSEQVFFIPPGKPFSPESLAHYLPWEKSEFIKLQTSLELSVQSSPALSLPPSHV